MSTIVLGIIIGIALLICMSFLKKGTKNSALDINLERVHCPKCTTLQPFLRAPANDSEALYGGTTCEHCGTEMDKYGKELNS
jgi:RNase P subunit RPR2